MFTTRDDKNCGMGTKMSISSLKTELLNESVLTVKLRLFNVDGTEITTWTSDSRLHIPQFYGFHCRRQDTRVSNASGVYLHAIASPVISHNSSTILRNIARFLTIPCNEIPNFILLFRSWSCSCLQGAQFTSCCQSWTRKHHSR